MRLKENYSPEVGPFYVIDGAVYADTDDIRDVEVTPAGFKDSSNGHYQYWRALQRYYPEFRDIDYDYYPRGRVVYNTKDDKYYLYADKCILKNQKLIDAVEEELDLPYNKVIISEDEHYQCHDCNEDYLDIYENYTLEGVSVNDDQYTFDLEQNFEEDFIDVEHPQLTESSIYGNTYYFSYKFKPTVPSKIKSAFIHWLKDLEGVQTPADKHNVKEFIYKAIKDLAEEIPLSSFSAIISPASGRSPLVSEIISCVGDVTGHNVVRRSINLIKSIPSTIAFDWDLFDADHPELNAHTYQQIKSYINDEVLPKIHASEYFSLARDVKPKYRKYIKDYLNTDPQSERFIRSLDQGSVLVIDDINTTGSTIAEIIRVIRTFNERCNIIIFTLLGKEDT